MLLLTPDDLIQPSYHPGKILRRDPCDSLSHTLDRQGSDLADLDPGSLRQLLGFKTQGQWEACSWFLTGDGNGDHGSRTVVEDIAAKDQDGSASRLFLSDCRIQIRPDDIAPQYSGHDPFS